MTSLTRIIRSQAGLSAPDYPVPAGLSGPDIWAKYPPLSIVSKKTADRTPHRMGRRVVRWTGSAAGFSLLRPGAARHVVRYRPGRPVCHPAHRAGHRAFLCCAPVAPGLWSGMDRDDPASHPAGFSNGRPDYPAKGKAGLAICQQITAACKTENYLWQRNVPFASLFLPLLLNCVAENLHKCILRIISKQCNNKVCISQ